MKLKTLFDRSDVDTNHSHLNKQSTRATTDLPYLALPYFRSGMCISEPWRAASVLGSLIGVVSTAFRGGNAPGSFPCIPGAPSAPGTPLQATFLAYLCTDVATDIAHETLVVSILPIRGRSSGAVARGTVALSIKASAEATGKAMTRAMPSSLLSSRCTMKRFEASLAEPFAIASSLRRPLIRWQSTLPSPTQAA